MKPAVIRPLEPAEVYALAAYRFPSLTGRLAGFAYADLGSALRYAARNRDHGYTCGGPVYWRRMWVCAYQVSPVPPARLAAAVLAASTSASVARTA